jgi:hypothetical protein
MKYLFILTAFILTRFRKRKIPMHFYHIERQGWKYVGLISIIILSSCSSDKLLKMAIKKGAKVTTESKIVRDTVTIEKVKDSIIYEKTVDTSRVKTICDSLINALPEQKPEIITKLQKEICPDVSELKKISIPITVEDSTYTIEVDLLLTAKGGHLSAYLTSKPKTITYEKSSTTTNTIEAPPQKIKWYHLVMAALVGGILFFFVSVLVRVMK